MHASGFCLCYEAVRHIGLADFCLMLLFYSDSYLVTPPFAFDFALSSDCFPLPCLDFTQYLTSSSAADLTLYTACWFCFWLATFVTAWRAVFEMWRNRLSAGSRNPNTLTSSYSTPSPDTLPKWRLTQRRLPSVIHATAAALLYRAPLCALLTSTVSIPLV